MTPDTTTVSDPLQALQERRAWRTRRINELRSELQVLIDEEAADHTRGTKVDLPGLKAECLQMKKDGKLIGAIKHFRAHTGLGLREAKDAVEALI